MAQMRRRLEEARARIEADPHVRHYASDEKEDSRFVDEDADSEWGDGGEAPSVADNSIDETPWAGRGGTRRASTR